MSATNVKKAVLAAETAGQEIPTTPAVVPSEPVDPRKGWVYVSIPERDMFDMPHPGIGHNRDHYGPGVHLLEPEVAAEVKDMLAKYEASNIRLLQPRKDFKSLYELAKVRGQAAVDLTKDNNKQV